MQWLKFTRNRIRTDIRKYWSRGPLHGASDQFLLRYRVLMPIAFTPKQLSSRKRIQEFSRYFWRPLEFCL